MDLLQLVVVFLGAALVIYLIYLAVTGLPVPPAFRVVVLIAVALMFLVCIGHATGCQVGRPLLR